MRNITFIKYLMISTRFLSFQFISFLHYYSVIYLSLNADIASNNGNTATCQNGLTSLNNRCRSNSSTERLNNLLPNQSNDKLGGITSDNNQSKLSEVGREYCVDLGRYLKVKYQMSGNPKSKMPITRDSDLGSELMVLTGTSTVHTDTVSHLRMLFKCYNTPLLNELRGGDLQGMVRRRGFAFLFFISCARYYLFFHIFYVAVVPL